MLGGRVLVGLAGLAGSGATAQPSLDFSSITLGEARLAPREVLARRVDPIVGAGLRLQSFNIHRTGGDFVFTSPARAVARGMCGRNHLVVETEPRSQGQWRFDTSTYVSIPPSDWWTAPLRVERSQQRATFHALPGARRSMSATANACARLGQDAPFFAANDVVAARRAVAILDAFRRQMAREPASVQTECGGSTDCRERLAASSVNDFASFEECGTRGLPPNLACAIFHPPVSRAWGHHNVQRYTLETDFDAEDGPVRIVGYVSTGATYD
ncbi:MAG TPA: hypothetical protein VF603_01335 [Allosphingosinicella sp.]|jgi:hypothetical protein